MTVKAFLSLSILTLITFLVMHLAMKNSTADTTSPTEPQIPAHLVSIDADKVEWKKKDLEYWRSVLSEDQFAVCRMAGTERPFSGKYCATKAKGNYYCSCCGQKLFSSDSKFDSGTGWPSFSDAAIPGSIEDIADTSHGMTRTEVRCSRCSAHLGHVFDDGPPPSGKRYCINSVCLFQKP